MIGSFDGPIAITGATGFIGRNLCDHLSDLGAEVRALVRDPSARPWSSAGIRTYACDLPGTIDPEGLAGAGAVIHCAYVTRHTDLEQARRVNDEGTRRLLALSRQAGAARFVFISSQSAHEEAESYYGRSKLALERLLDAGRDLIIRPGLVLGPGEAGLFERMCRTVRSSRVIPLFGGGKQPLQTVHIDDLCEAIATALGKRLTGVLTVAESDPIPMARFLKLVAAGVGSKPMFVPVPLLPALAALRTLEALGIPFPVSSENLLGLKCMRAVDTRPDLDALGVSLRSASESLRRILGGGA